MLAGKVCEGVADKSTVEIRVVDRGEKSGTARSGTSRIPLMPDQIPF